MNIATKNIVSAYDNQFVVSWQPTLGNAEFKIELNKRSVQIKCNFLQAILLTFINEHNRFTINDFSRKTHLNSKLSEKIIQSVFESNLITKSGKTDNTYVYIVNENNYTGPTMIDIRPLFVDAFDQTKPNPEDGFIDVRVTTDIIEKSRQNTGLVWNDGDDENDVSDNEADITKINTDKKNATAKKNDTDSEFGSNAENIDKDTASRSGSETADRGDSDSETHSPLKKVVVKPKKILDSKSKSGYLSFVKDELKRQKEANPNRTSTENMRAALASWKEKQQSEINDDASDSSYDDDDS